MYGIYVNGDRPKSKRPAVASLMRGRMADRPRKGEKRMANQTDPQQNADTVGQMVGSLLIKGAAAVVALDAAQAAFAAGDVEQAKLIVHNASSWSHPSGGGGFFDLDMLVYECLYRGPGEAPSGA